MIFKISTYRLGHEKNVQDTYRDVGVNGIALYCAVSFCPVLAAYWFCREIDPENKELTRRIESVRIFYGIDDVEE